LPKDLQEQLHQRIAQARRKAATRVVHVGDEAFPILDYSDTGFAVDAEDAAHLRGLIDIYEGVTHLTQALIVASAQDGDLMRYEFKRNTRASARGAERFRARDAEADTPADARLSPLTSAHFLRFLGKSLHEFPGNPPGCPASPKNDVVHAISCRRIPSPDGGRDDPDALSPFPRRRAGPACGESRARYSRLAARQCRRASSGWRAARPMSVCPTWTWPRRRRGREDARDRCRQPGRHDLAGLEEGAGGRAGGGFDLASGLHNLLRDEEDLAAVARATGRSLHDVRVPT
jgi:hypothetical protein